RANYKKFLNSATTDGRTIGDIHSIFFHGSYDAYVHFHIGTKIFGFRIFQGDPELDGVVFHGREDLFYTTTQNLATNPNLNGHSYPDLSCVHIRHLTFDGITTEVGDPY